ncbi:MAG TPA: aldo/keto reductase, partial [Candidatus Binataceae bacterium]|nr:aldo/keto reductase [Candidatus Binataceae bacterium]
DRLATVQLLTNVLCSEGEMGAPGDAPHRDHLEMVRLASAAGLGVFGIRPFAAGSLTNGIDRNLPLDHRVAADFALAQRELRFLSNETGGSMAFAVMRYALSLPGVSSVVTGAKNRNELAEAVSAAETGPLSQTLMERISLWQKSRAGG